MGNVAMFAKATSAEFAFGENWIRFLPFVDDRRIKLAEDSLTSYLGDLNGKAFIDVGCGSGLFSLAARRLGAKVLSFDLDPRSVACAQELKLRYRPGDSHWVIERGNVLDQKYLITLGRFDVVYSWGVLHHTGKLWAAMENTSRLVSPGGLFFVSIYNDQGGTSGRWKWIKRTYNSSGAVIRWLLLLGVAGYFEGKRSLAQLRDRRNLFKRPEGDRGMLFKTDLVDWVGGWPFEVATPHAVFEFCKAHGFSLEKLKTSYGLGCNEFVFQLRS